MFQVPWVRDATIFARGYRITTSLAQFGAPAASKMLEIYTNAPRDLVNKHLVRRNKRKPKGLSTKQLTRLTPRGSS
eukprot:8213296-Pyramimonas_sp.AAC.1